MGVLVPALLIVSAFFDEFSTTFSLLHLFAVAFFVLLAPFGNFDEGSCKGLI